jgi:tRNA modification GTPase
VARRADGIVASLRRLLEESSRFERLNHEPRIVLAGKPNAGKSTLLNALAGTTRAVESDVAGTTRDALSTRVALKRGWVTLVDVAGLGSDPTTDPVIARQMLAQARSEIDRADAVALVIESNDDSQPVDLGRAADLVVCTKSDLRNASISQTEYPSRRALENSSVGVVDSPTTLRVSSFTRQGIDALQFHLDQIAFGPATESARIKLTLNARHESHLQNAIDSLGRVESAIDSGAEFAAHELRSALDELGGVLGAVSPDDLLGRIFSKFCIGK